MNKPQPSEFQGMNTTDRGAPRLTYFSKIMIQILDPEIYYDQGLNNDDLEMILCVHGYRQNGNVFKSKLGGFRKSLKKYAEFVFFDAPHTICHQDNSEVSEADTPEQYGWWFSEEDRTFMSKKPSDTCIGFEESLARVEDLCEKEGPFDGLLGFSQGAAFVGLLCQLQEMKCKFLFSLTLTHVCIISTF
uniref:Serine hydrolase domain-containing protein n=1 Tax=Timema genevievae TaxID=629358 RepID=A0A7R9JVK6_TIMGE|nr:unnamed protein product [Timema genevievae]